MVGEICYFGLQKDLKMLQAHFMTVKMTRETSGFSDAFIFKDSTFAAVDLFCPPRVGVQDYWDKQHWEGEGTGKKQKKAFTGCQFYSSPLG